MNETGIETRLVYGFLDAGKTTYIEDCIRNDFFHKYGKTLILCFEQGEAEYDEEALSERRSFVAYYDANEDVGAFCLRAIDTHHPDRIYVEMNTMMQDLKEKLPSSMRIVSAVTWIDWATLDLYFANFRQMISRMVGDSLQVTFRGCPSKELLSPYSQAFRLMNQKASYLRQDAMGYHEKAFDLFLPFSLEDSEITVTKADFLPLWLDALDHPEHYEGKKLKFADPLELRYSPSDGAWSVGRIVMICCMADLQFMSFCLEADGQDRDEGWIILEAAAGIKTGTYGQRSIKLTAEKISHTAAPKSIILDSRGQDASEDA